MGREREGGREGGRKTGREGEGELTLVKVSLMLPRSRESDLGSEAMWAVNWAKVVSTSTSYPVFCSERVTSNTYTETEDTNYHIIYTKVTIIKRLKWQLQFLRIA